MVRFAIVVVRQ